MSLKVIYWITAFFVITYFSGVFHIYYYGTKEYAHLNYTQYLINIFAAVFYQKIVTRYSLVKVILISIFIGLASFIMAYTAQEIFHTGTAQFPFTSRYSRYFSRVIVLALIMPTLYVNIFVAVTAYFVFKGRKRKLCINKTQGR